MTMNKALHSKEDVDRLYVSRKEERRGLANIEDSVDHRRLQRKTDYSHQKNTNIRINKTKITRKQKWGEKTTV